jgi:hypothetical protein
MSGYEVGSATWPLTFHDERAKGYPFPYLQPIPLSPFLKRPNALAFEAGGGDAFYYVALGGEVEQDHR